MSDSMSEDGALVLTGAGGWFGRAFLHAARSGGLPDPRPTGRIRALAGSPAEVEPILAVHPGAEIVVGDVTDPDTVERLLSGLREATVVHAAGVIHPRSAAEFERTNVGSTRTVLEQARRHGVRRLVHLSSNSPIGVNAGPEDVFGNDEPYDPYLGYGRSKMHAELLVRAATDLETVIVRPPWFYGRFQPERQTSFFRMVRTGRFPLVGRGDQRRSMVDVADLARGAWLAATVDRAVGGCYWIADERPYPMAEIVDTVKRVLAAEGFEVSPRQLRVPAILSRMAERADRMIQAAGGYHQEVHVLGELDKTIACDVGAAVADLGYRPSTELFEGMRDAVRWCVARGLDI